MRGAGGRPSIDECLINEVVTLRGFQDRELNAIRPEVANRRERMAAVEIYPVDAAGRR